jgi:membrane protease subunit HflK
VIGEFRRVQDEKITKETARQNALAFESREIPDARAQKNRMEQSARAFKDTLVATANAELSEFQLLHEQYEKSPGLVWERIYQEAIEAVLSNVKQLRFVTPGDQVIIPEKENTPECGEKQP